MKKLFMAFVLVILLCNLSGFAQDIEEEEKDILEIIVFGGAALPMSGLTDWTSPGGPKIGTDVGFDIGLDFGLFLTPDVVLGLDFTYSQHTLNTDEDAGNLKHRFYNPSLYLKRYFFGESNLVPYVKVHAGVDNPKFTTLVLDKYSVHKLRELSYDPIFALGIGGGFLYYTADYSGVFLEVNYHYAFSDETTGTYDDVDYIFGENAAMLDVRVGVKVFFGTGE